MRLSIRHSTRYLYEVAPDLGLLQLRVRPTPNALQSIDEWSVEFSGLRKQAEFRDQYGNIVELVEIVSKEKELELSVTGQVTTFDRGGILGEDNGNVPLWLFTRQTELTRPNGAIQALCDPFRAGVAEGVAQLHEVSAAILDAVPYTTGKTKVTTTAAEALESKNGVCQDHAHIFLSVVRLLGYPARYISGYLCMTDRDEQDASHAWTEVYVKDLGWVGFDISNGISPDERYVRLAVGLDYRDAAPTHGIVRGADREKLVVSINVQQ